MRYLRQQLTHINSRRYFLAIIRGGLKIRCRALAVDGQEKSSIPVLDCWRAGRQFIVVSCVD
jgi:hypothetical protein